MIAKPKEWLRERQTGLGGTDVAAIAGVGFLDAIDVYRQKTAAEVHERPPTERMHLGTILESEVARRFAEETGYDQLYTAPEIVHHPHNGWQLCSPDRFTKPKGGRMVELKCVFGPASKDWGPSGSDEVPAGYLIQVTNDLAVCMANKLVEDDYADVGVLFVGFEFRRYQIPLNADLWQKLSDLGYDFWNVVQKRDEQAAVDWDHPLAKQVRKDTFRIAQGSILFGDDAGGLLDLHDFHRAEEKKHKAEADAAKDQLIAMMGTFSDGHFPDGSKVTRKTVNRKGYTVGPSSYVDTRFRRPKGRPE
jgi:putative phage-type endonuclease